MNNEMGSHSVVYNIVTTLPIVGRPAGFLFDYTSMGIRQYGYLLGLVRGGVVGGVMFVLLLTLSEGIPLCWDIVHYYFQMRYVESVKAEERGLLLNWGSGKGEWRDVLDFDLGWLDPGRYLLTQHPKGEEPASKTEDR
jgi:hypothetical protein